MKVKTLIKKLQELGDKYQDAEVTVRHPIYPDKYVPLKYKVDTNYCFNRKTDKCELIVILTETFKLKEGKK